MIRIVNMIPVLSSGETNQDSEPNIAVNPQRPTDMVGTAFTPALSGNFAPIYVSTDHGATWSLRNVVPGNGFVGTGDITVSFATTSGILHAAILNGQTGNMQILRTANFTSITPMEVLVDRGDVDQPWTIAGTVVAGPGVGEDRAYVGSNDFNQPGGQTATVDRSLDAGTAPPPAGFDAFAIEHRSTVSQDGPPVRSAFHQDGTVYAAFQRWPSGSGLDFEMEPVVVRDDNWGTGTTPFRDLIDSTDGVIGQRVDVNRFVRFFAQMGQERLGADMAIAVDPNNSSNVWLTWCDRVGGSTGTDWTVHVRRSTDRGQTWSGDLRTITDGKNPSLAVNTDSRVALLFQEFTGTQWITQLELTDDGWATPAENLVLHQAPSGIPVRTFQPYIGDYARLIAIDKDFYGVFCGNNTPDLANFPNGVTYQRNADFTTNVLLDIDNVTPVAVSIDPFFVHWSEDQRKVQPSSGFAIQGQFGTKGNFEVVAPLQAGRLAHFWRDNDAPNLPWHGPTVFGSTEAYDAVALIQSNFSTAGGGPGNLEVVAHTGRGLVHYWRDDVDPFPWFVSVAIPGSSGTSGTPTLIQGGFGSKGNFEVVVPLASGGLAHFWRDNDAGDLPWHGPTPFGSTDVYDAVALIQSNFSTSGSGPGNLEVIAHTGNRLDHYWRDDVDPFPWHGPFAIPGATGIG
jgi:hypothetical protein